MIGFVESVVVFDQRFRFRFCFSTININRYCFFAVANIATIGTNEIGIVFLQFKCVFDIYNTKNSGAIFQHAADFHIFDRNLAIFGKINVERKSISKIG